MKLFSRLLSGGLAIALSLLIFVQPAWAFCGFYVSKADTSLYNQASQVIIARDGDRTILTMANDFKGDVTDFAMVVPVPTLITEEQVNVGNPTIMARLDAFSAPRLVEYFDPDPCAPPIGFTTLNGARRAAPAPAAESADLQKADLGVTVEAKFTVGEYDILILSAKESNGLETWLKQNDYRIPEGASAILQPYIRQGMKFFVAKVNLQELDKSGFQSLRPLAIAYESPKFVLPIRLGMANAQGDQDLIVYLLSPEGQIELTNYRTVKVPSDVEIPEYVEEEFAPFYQAMFQKAYEQEGKKVAFLEYAWDMANCDPCSAQPLSPDELRQAGVFWLNDAAISPRPGWGRPVQRSTFISRLHVRYSLDKFPTDLQFQSTQNRQLFQGRYVIRHPFTGAANCSAGQDYRQRLRDRQEAEAQTLAKLTGWDINEIRRKIPFVAENPEPTPWWRSVWPN